MKFSATKPLQFSWHCLKMQPWLFILSLAVGWPATLLGVSILTGKNFLPQISHSAEVVTFIGLFVILLIISSVAQVIIIRQASKPLHTSEKDTLPQKKYLSPAGLVVCNGILATAISALIIFLCYFLPIQTNGQIKIGVNLAAILLIILTLWKTFAVFFVVEYDLNLIRSSRLSLDLLKRRWAEILLLSIELGVLYVLGFFVISGTIAGVSKISGGFGDGLASLTAIMIIWVWLSVQNILIFISLYAAFRVYTAPIKTLEAKLAVEPLP